MRLAAIFVLCALAGACVANESAPTTGAIAATTPSTLESAPDGTGVATPPGPTETTVDSTRAGVDPVVARSIPEAVTLSVAGARDGDAVVAWKTETAVLIARFDPDSGELSQPTEVQGADRPFAHPIERPAVAVDDSGTVHVAFTAHAEGGGSVVYRTWDGTAVGGPGVISGEARPETNLVHITLGDGGPVLSWLEDSTLSVGFGEGSIVAEVESVDDLTCDCCNPAPLVLSDGLFVGYRDRDLVDGEVVRDVTVVRSADGLEYSPPLRVADDHWFLDACPFSGPSAIDLDGTIVMAWMDARQSVHPDQRGTTIWVDRSIDGGATFGTDLAVSGPGIHRWPVMAVDAKGAVHLVWETQGADGGILHAVSLDGGRSFGSPRTLVRSDRAPRTPSVDVHGEALIVTWVDSTGGQVARYDLGDLHG